MARPRTGIIDRFRLDESTGCWNWTGTFNKESGYGQSHWKGRKVLAHRLAAMLWLRFDINSALRVLHRCDNPRCINPKHLFIGTLSANTVDSIAKGRHFQASKMVCKSGHPFDAQNTYMRPSGGRACKICKSRSKRRLR